MEPTSNTLRVPPELLNYHQCLEEKLDTKCFDDDMKETLIQAGRGSKDRAIAFAWKETQPKEIASFFDKVFIESLDGRPQQLTQIALLESVGIRSHNSFLNDVSVNGKTDVYEKQKTLLDTLEKYDFDSLSEEEKTSYRILSWTLTHAVAGGEFLFHNYPINQFFSILTDLSDTLTQFHPLNTAKDFDRYQDRLASISIQLEQAKEMILKQWEMGIFPPKFAFEKTISSLKELVDTKFFEHPFYQYFISAYEKREDYDVRSVQRIEHLLKITVNPAYEDLIQFLEKLSGKIETNHSCSALPNGKEYYEYCLKQETTTEYTPKEIHQMGLIEVEKIETQMREIFMELGINDPDLGVGEMMTKLSNDEKHLYPNTKEGRQECLNDFETILARARKELGPLFDLKPNEPVEIVTTPKHEEEGMPGGYYHDPSLDGTRPGKFFVNLRDTKELPRYGMETLLVHEAEPGHHFQLALQVLSDLPLFRRSTTDFNAYIEGWALYVEKLAYEKGFYSTPYNKLGHFQDELLRASRLVVDTGLHAFNWSREKAIEYMVKTLGYQKETVVTEVERYLVWPGQACSYKVGQLKILELRQKAMDTLKEDFDIRKFHNIILEVGACPLEVLEQEINTYIKKALE